MYKTISIKSLFVTGSLALTLALVGCASTTPTTTAPHQETVGNFVDGSTVTAKVKAKLLADSRVSSFPITVNTYKGVVQLSGFVDNRRQKNLAVSIARGVDGVRAVQDSLVVKRR